MMTNEINGTTRQTKDEKPKSDYIGSDGLLYCGKCNTPKEAYFTKGTFFGRSRHPSQCKCQRTMLEECEKREQLARVERLKCAGFTDRSMREWTFAGDNGKNEKIKLARLYVEHWDEMKTKNQGYLLWGDIGTGKSYFAGCIANALMEKGVDVRMTNFAAILNDLMGSFTGRNAYISWLCGHSLLILDDFGMERGTEFGLEQVYHVVDSRYRSRKPLIVTTNLTLAELKNPPDIAHGRIYDRILAMCTPVCFSGGSLRQEKTRKNMDSLQEMLKQSEEEKNKW